MSACGRSRRIPAATVAPSSRRRRARRVAGKSPEHLNPSGVSIKVSAGDFRGLAPVARGFFRPPSLRPAADHGGGRQDVTTAVTSQRSCRGSRPRCPPTVSADCRNSARRSRHRPGPSRPGEAQCESIAQCESLGDFRGAGFLQAAVAAPGGGSRRRPAGRDHAVTSQRSCRGLPADGF